MRRVPAVPTGLAALVILALLILSLRKVSTPVLESSAHYVTTPAPTSTRPAPTTTVPAATTVPSVAPAGGSAPGRVCTQPSVPRGGGATELATPLRPNLPYSASAGGPTVGYVTNPWGGPSARPVVDQQNDWVQIRLYARPNGSVGWVRRADVSFTTTAYRVVVSICQRTLTLFQGADPVYAAPVGVGRPQWPTPVGASFVDAIVTTPRSELSIYGPTVIMLGTHSNVFTDFDGGDGVVAIHGYPSDPASTRGVISSHGCVRASAATVNTVKGVPVGTPVDVIA